MRKITQRVIQTMAVMHGSTPVDKVPDNYVRRFYSGLFEKKEAK